MGEATVSSGFGAAGGHLPTHLPGFVPWGFGAAPCLGVPGCLPPLVVHSRPTAATLAGVSIDAAVGRFPALIRDLP